jgi:hypothetical protein
MLAQLITASANVVLLGALITVIIRLRLHGHNALSGRSPIPVGMLIAGKLSIAASIVLMLLRALGFSIGPTCGGHLTHPAQFSPSSGPLVIMT